MQLLNKSEEAVFLKLCCCFLVSCRLLYLCQNNSVSALDMCLLGVAEETGGARPGTHGVGEVSEEGGRRRGGI